MRSKTSFFSLAIFWNNIKRFWPIWASYLVIWLFMMPVTLWRSIEDSIRYGYGYTAADLQYRVLGSVSGTSMAMAFIYAIAVAVAVFAYLYSSKSAGMLHALPVRREGLYLTAYVTGLVFLLVPLVIVFLVTLGVEAAMGMLAAGDLCLWLAASAGLCVFFFSFASFCAVFTGLAPALAAFYLILNFVVKAVEMLAVALLSFIVFGMSGNASFQALDFLTPVYFIINRAEIKYIAETESYIFTNGYIIAAYAAAGVVLAVIGLLIYRKRNVEAAGDAVAHKSMRPVFKYGVAFCAALVLTVFVMAICYSSYTPSAPIAVAALLVACGFIGYFAAEMILKKSFRVFKSGIKGWLIFSAVLIVIVAAVHFDLFGYEKRIPDASAVESVNVSAAYNEGNLLTDADLITEAVAVHRLVYENKADIRAKQDSYRGGSENLVNLRLTYRLKDGSVLEREYNFLDSRELLNDLDSPASAIDGLVNRPELTVQRMTDKGKVSEDTIYNITVSFEKQSGEGYIDYEEVMLTGDDALTVFEAMLRDAASGGLGRTEFLYDSEYNRTYYVNSIYINYYERPQRAGETFRQYQETVNMYSYYATLSTASVNTIKALEELGCFDGEHRLILNQESREYREYYLQ